MMTRPSSREGISNSSPVPFIGAGKRDAIEETKKFRSDVDEGARYSSGVIGECLKTDCGACCGTRVTTATARRLAFD